MTSPGLFRPFLLALLASATAASAVGGELHRSRGPNLPVVRASAQSFPTRVQTEEPSPFGVGAIANRAWAGSPSDEMVAASGPTDAAQWLATRQPTAWERLRAIQDAEFPQRASALPD